MIDMGQADRTLRHTPSGDNDGVFKRHRELMRRTAMKVKTSEAEGEVLNYLVAKAMGKTVYQSKSKRLMTAKYGEFNHRHGAPWFSPSTDWAQAGPIIEREHLKVVYFASSREWNVSKLRYGGLCEPHDMKDPSLLVAAMRCYVASKLGDEVEVPDEIVS